MMRLIRKLTGTSRREAEADKAVEDHKRESEQQISCMKRDVSAVEKLVQELRKDATQWPLC